MMNKKLSIALIVFGITIIVGGLITHFSGVNTQLPIPRPDIFAIGTSIVGYMLALLGSEGFESKTEEEQIEENDERNKFIKNKSLAFAYKLFSVLFMVAIFLLIFMGYMNEISTFTLLGVFLISNLGGKVMKHKINKAVWSDKR